MDRRMAMWNARMVRNRVLAAMLAGSATGLGFPTTSGDAQESDTAMTCTNPASGASWRIVIDYGRASVDANPARITAAEISWFDPKDGGNYTLDRSSGNLTVSVASSTGGYFRHSRCSPEKSR
jgi:hypothetical protein